MRELASIQTIADLRPIKDADKIEVATVLGWEVVVGKGEFSIGDSVVYVEVDSIMPALPEFEFLKPRKYKIRTIKLKKQVSQGICFPLSVLPKGKYKIGQDVTEALGVTKYDPQALREAQLNNERQGKIQRFLLKNKWYRRFFTKEGERGWPKFIKKTDEERIQRIPNICEIAKGINFIATEKLDGQSATYALVRLPRRFWHFKDRFKFIVCSRNLHLRKPNNSSYWTIAKQLNIEEVLYSMIFSTDDYIVLQGEIIGEGIQKNKYNIKGYDFYAFNVIHSWVGKRDDHMTMEIDLQRSKIKCVPLISNNFILKDSIHECVDLAKGKSTLCDIHREGLVLRNYEKDISFKIINPDFLLRYQDEEEC